MKTLKNFTLLFVVIATLSLASCSTPHTRIIKYTTNDNCAIEFKEGKFGDAILVSNEYNEKEKCFYAVFDKDVKLIDEETFSENNNLTSILLPDSVRNIGEKAFYACENLLEITIPCRVTDIGEYAFARNFELQRVIMAEGVRTIGNGAFLQCGNLVNIAIPRSVTNIGAWAFQDCKKLNRLDVPNKNATIGQDAFDFHFSENIMKETINDFLRF